MSKFYVVEKKYFGVDLSSCDSLGEASTISSARAIKNHYRNVLSKDRHNINHIVIFQEVK